MIYSAAGDLFNQLPNVGKTIAAAGRLEFMVVHDHFMTPTARYADVVLPANQRSGSATTSQRRGRRGPLR